MFKSLRREFMVMNILLILTVLYGALAAFYFVSWLRVDQSTTVTLARHLSTPYYEPLDGENLRLFVSSITVSAWEYIRDVPTSNIFKYFDTHYVSDSFSTAQTDRILKQIVEADAPDGMLQLDGRHFKYVRQQVDRKTMRIAVLEVTSLVNNLHSTLNILLLIAITSLPFVFLVSKITTDRSIRPLETMVMRQREFFSDISHELKTPLTIAFTNMAVVEAHREETVASQEKWLGYIKYQLERLSNLVNEMIYLESMRLPDFAQHQENIELGSLIHHYIESVAAVMHQKNLTLQADLQPGVFFYADKEAITKLVSVLIDNAIKYTLENGIITVTLAQTSKKIIFTVRNTGEGIEPQHMERIFDRLYRVRKSRSTSEGGRGLGLAIAKSVVERYHGTINVESTVGEFAAFTVTLPRPANQQI